MTTIVTIILVGAIVLLAALLVDALTFDDKTNKIERKVEEAIAHENEYGNKEH